jgi:hypothetical protein
MLDLASSSTLVWAGFSQLIAMLFLFAAVIKLWDFISETLFGAAKTK